MVLPAPFGPMRPYTEPALTFSDTPSTAVFTPKRFVTLVRRMAISTGFFFRFFAPSATKTSAEAAPSFA